MNTPLLLRSPGRSARGFSLIELLVGVLIISFGLLGLLTLQARTLQMSTTTEDSMRAALLAQEIAATMINANNVNVTPAQQAAWAASAADPTSIGMPNGTVAITVTAPNAANIQVTWRSTGSTAAANDTFRYNTTVVLP